MWVTIAGNPQTYVEAGRAGYRILTHLLGQSVEELAEKLQLYRAAWREAAHPGRPHVTLMLHTDVGDDDAAVKEAVRAPMREDPRSAMDLVKAAAWSFPMFKDRVASGGQSMDQLFSGGGSARTRSRRCSTTRSSATTTAARCSARSRPASRWCAS